MKVLFWGDGCFSFVIDCLELSHFEEKAFSFLLPVVESFHLGLLAFGTQYYFGFLCWQICTGRDSSFFYKIRTAQSLFVKLFRALRITPEHTSLVPNGAELLCVAK